MRSELVVPLWVAGELWGVLNVEELEADAFDEDDLRLMETLADQAGSALRSASLYEQLDRAYLGTAEALAAALEAKDSYTADHGRSIVEHAEAVGRRLGMDAGRAARSALRRRLPRHRQDRGARGDPQQARRADARGARRDRAPHDRRRADPRARRVPRRRPPARAPRARALGRPRLPGPPRGRPASRSARASSSPATRSTR